MAISKHDILEALGMEARGITEWLTPALIGFGVGALVGATVAFLFAPKSGSEVREDLMERGRRYVERGREVFSGDKGARETTPAPPIT